MSKEKENSPASKSLFSFYTLCAIVSLLIINIGMHAPFLLTDYSGEPDGASIINDAAIAAYSGGFHDLHYTVYSSPLYSDVLRLCFKNKVISISNAPFWMAFSTLISSAIVTIALFISVFQLTRSILASIGACIILQLMPVFWSSSLYGFPSIVSLAFFMVSFVLFQYAVKDHPSEINQIFLVAAAVLFVISVLFKIDCLLASPIYCLPVWKSDRSLKTKTIWTVSLAVFSGITFLIFDQYARSLYHFFYTKWNSYWPLDIVIFFSKKHIKLMARTVGIASIPATFAALMLLARRKEWRSTILWLVLASLPLLLFWGMREANLSRHYFIPALFLAILLSLPLALNNWQRWFWAFLLFCIFFVNYFYFPPTSSIRHPSGRLLSSAGLFRQKVTYFHKAGELIANLPHEKVAFVGPSWRLPLFRYEILKRKDLMYTRHRVTAERAVLEMKGQDHTFSFLGLNQLSPDVSLALSLSKSGYFLVVEDDNLEGELSQRPELRDKWISIEKLVDKDF
jgi:hypothetical protein